MRLLNKAMWAVIVLGLMCMGTVGGYMYHSHMIAERILEYCNLEGHSDCHIERDGVEYNVYFGDLEDV